MRFLRSRHSALYSRTSRRAHPGVAAVSLPLCARCPRQCRAVSPLRLRRHHRAAPGRHLRPAPPRPAGAILCPGPAPPSPGNGGGWRRPGARHSRAWPGPKAGGFGGLTTSRLCSGEQVFAARKAVRVWVWCRADGESRGWERGEGAGSGRGKGRRCHCVPLSGSVSIAAAACARTSL